MADIFIIGECQELDWFNYEIGAISVEHFLKHIQRQWDLLDRLYADKAYWQTCLARDLYKSGKLDQNGWLQVCVEIDEQLAEYDNLPSTLYRRDLIAELRDTSRRFRQAARADREARKETLRVA